MILMSELLVKYSIVIIEYNINAYIINFFSILWLSQAIHNFKLLESRRTKFIEANEREKKPEEDNTTVR